MYISRLSVVKTFAARDSGNLKEFCKGYNILNLINNFRDSWTKIKQSILMEKTLPAICNRLSIRWRDSEQITKEFVDLGRQLNLGMDVKVVDELIYLILKKINCSRKTSFDFSSSMRYWRMQNHMKTLCFTARGKGLCIEKSRFSFTES